MNETDELERLRSRLHKLADNVQVIMGRLGEHDLRIGALTAELQTTRADMATAAQVKGAVELLTVKIENVEKTMSLQLQLIQESFGPVRKGFYWAVGILIGSVLLSTVTYIITAGHAR